MRDYTRKRKWRCFQNSPATAAAAPTYHVLDASSHSPMLLISHSLKGNKASSRVDEASIATASHRSYFRPAGNLEGRCNQATMDAGWSYLSSLSQCFYWKTLTSVTTATFSHVFSTTGSPSTLNYHFTLNLAIKPNKKCIISELDRYIFQSASTRIDKKTILKRSVLSGDVKEAGSRWGVCVAESPGDDPEFQSFLKFCSLKCNVFPTK